MLLFVLCTLAEAEWLETTQQDFADGIYERDLYASFRGNGSVEFAPRWDANDDGWMDILSVNVYGGSTIFLGGPHGYSDGRKLFYAEGIGGGAFADLDIDGFTDFVVTGILGTHIYPGKEGGPDQNNPFELGEGEEACFVADFNKDGWLDIAFDYADPETAGIYWGSSSGYSDENVTHLPVSQAQHNMEAADLNKDGWLDLLYPNQYGNSYTIYWGGTDGFAASNKTDIPFLSSYIHGASVADLDADGELDLIFTGNYGIYESWIYWGPEYKSSEKTVLETGECYGGSVVADLNKDGRLDIVYFRGAREENAYKTRIQWGDGNRFRNDCHDLVGPSSRASGGLVADFNRDGTLDIFFNSYNEASPILWGPDYSAECATYLHGGIDHHSLAREIGNVYTREYKEIYYSSIYDTKMDLNWIEYEYDASCPGSSKIHLAIRTGAHLDDFKQTTIMSASTEKDDWLTLGDNERIESALMGCNQRYIQYRVIFEYVNPAQLPSLEEVGIIYEGESLKPTSSSGESREDVTLAVNPEGYSRCRIKLSSIPGTPVQLCIYDAGGRLVSTLIDSRTGTGTSEFLWEGLDDQGKATSNGVYFIRLVQQQKVENVKFMLIR